MFVGTFYGLSSGIESAHAAAFLAGLLWEIDPRRARRLTEQARETLEEYIAAAGDDPKVLSQRHGYLGKYFHTMRSYSTACGRTPAWSRMRRPEASSRASFSRKPASE